MAPSVAVTTEGFLLRGYNGKVAALPHLRYRISPD